MQTSLGIVRGSETHEAHLNREMARAWGWAQTAETPHHGEQGGDRREDGMLCFRPDTKLSTKVPALENQRRHSLLFANTDSASAEREAPLRCLPWAPGLPHPRPSPVSMLSSMHLISSQEEQPWGGGQGGPSGDSLLKQVFIRGVHSCRLNRVCR